MHRESETSYKCESRVFLWWLSLPLRDAIRRVEALPGRLKAASHPPYRQPNSWYVQSLNICCTARSAAGEFYVKAPAKWGEMLIWSSTFSRACVFNLIYQATASNSSIVFHARLRLYPSHQGCLTIAYYSGPRKASTGKSWLVKIRFFFAIVNDLTGSLTDTDLNSDPILSTARC
jgi:hypothetical protein